jgi:hypothetical protein
MVMMMMVFSGRLEKHQRKCFQYRVSHPNHTMAVV